MLPLRHRRRTCRGGRQRAKTFAVAIRPAAGCAAYLYYSRHAPCCGPGREAVILRVAAGLPSAHAAASHGPATVHQYREETDVYHEIQASGARSDAGCTLYILNARVRINLPGKHRLPPRGSSNSVSLVDQLAWRDSLGPPWAPLNAQNVTLYHRDPCQPAKQQEGPKRNDKLC